MTFPDETPHRDRTARRVAPVLLLFALAVIGIVMTPTVGRAQRRVEVYAPKHRLASELEPLAQVALDGSGSVAVDRGTNRLVLIGEGEAIGKVLALLAEQDRALRQVVLRYDTRRRSALAAQGFDVAWSASAGAYRLGRLRARAGAPDSIRVRGSALEDRLVATLHGQMRVVEGGTTRIETGHAVPYTSSGSYGTNTQIVDATTGFEAKPRILADGRVRVDLAGFADRFQADGAIATMRTATLFDLEPGKVVVVGAIDRIEAQDRSALAAGTASERRQDETLLLLRADLED
jgi:hypothetical protein